MKKDIFRGLMALFFIFLTLLSTAYLQEMKDEAKLKKRESQNKNYDKNYTSNLVDSEFNLPIVIIDTNGNPIQRQEDISANIQVFDNKMKTNKLVSEPDLESKVNISIRGNSTSKYPKKQYSLELTNKKGEEVDKKVLGMDKGSDWVLNGPFSDKSLMRNYLAYNVGRNIMTYAPNVKFCEVFIVDDNNSSLEEEHYKGVYLMIEKIKRGDDRVDISKSQDNVDETSFIICKDRTKENDISLNNYGIQTYMDSYSANIEYPKKDLTPAKYNYINKYISEFERVLYSDKFNDPINGYSKYIDVDSFVDFYIINEFFKNTDAGLYSTYFYKDYEEKLKVGPIWDFNKSLGNHNDEIGQTYDYTSFFMINRPWFDRLMEDKNFNDAVKKRYKELRKTYLSDQYLLNLIDETVELLGDAVKRNFYKWPVDISNQAEVFEESGDISGDFSSDIKIYKQFLEDNNHLLKDTTHKSKSYEEEISMMKDFIVNRGKWIDDNIDSLNKWGN